ncbi:MAG TPA: transglutaminase-like cysteine peptidase, partial [Xanthobacteraceae bacterium]|nr:transglutaminase-like cysteine peptidase [Xanthobacteraceae bacterium]
MRSRTKTILRRSAVAIFVAATLIATEKTGTAQERGQERPLFISVGEATRAPIGWVEFCVEYDPECKTRPSAPRDVVLSGQAWKDLVRINRWVNTTVKPMT